MMTLIAAMALAAAPAAPAGTNPQPMQMGQMQGMDMSQMDHSKMNMSQMDPSKMNMSQMDQSKMAKDGCCKQTANGKMECNMPGMKSGGNSAHQGNSGQ